VRRIERAGWPIPDGLRFVALDLARDDLRVALERAGFERQTPAFFSWLGVTRRRSKRATSRIAPTAIAPSSTFTSRPRGWPDQSHLET
jgi:O-methyltransferase involved in polyketide biosynthesis